MEKYKVGFKGEKYLENSLEDYINNWVLFSLRGNGSYAGKLVNLNEREASFLPYQKVTYDDQGIAKYIVEEKGKPHTHERMNIVNFRESSKKEALNFCKNMNRKVYLEYLRERKEIYESENKNKEIDNSQKKIIIGK